MKNHRGKGEIMKKYIRRMSSFILAVVMMMTIALVKKGTLIEKAVTGDDGTAAFTADLPIGFSYCVKEEQAPEGYLRNTKDVYSFAFSYTNDSEAVVSLGQHGLIRNISRILWGSCLKHQNIFLGAALM